MQASTHVRPRPRRGQGDGALRSLGFRRADLTKSVGPLNDVKFRFFQIDVLPGKPRNSEARRPVKIAVSRKGRQRATGRFRAGDLFVFDDLDGLFLAPRAFKGALIVVWRFGLDTDEPHLNVTRFGNRGGPSASAAELFDKVACHPPTPAFVYF